MEDNAAKVIARRQLLAASGGLAMFVSAPGLAASSARRTAATSPDGRVRITLLFTHDGAPPAWTAEHDGQTVIEPSSLRLLLDHGWLGPGAEVTGVKRRAHTGRWSPPYGAARDHDESYEEVIISLLDRAHGIGFEVIARAYDHGVALRYRLASAPGSQVRIVGEDTGFDLPDGATLWSSRDEGEYQIGHPGRLSPVPHPDLTASTDVGNLADLPLTVRLRNGRWLSITESDRRHYPRPMFHGDPATGGVAARLMRYPGRATGYSGPGNTDPETSFTVPVPFETPWRVVMVAERPAQLIERAALVPTLAAPSRIADPGWIRPGRLLRIREPYTTQRAIDCALFAQERRLDYVMFDAHWYGDGTDASNATAAISELDMPAIMAECRRRGIGMILYVDRVPAMNQLDALLAAYRDWGVAGIKFGFVWEGRQSDNDFIERLIMRCAEHGLFVNLHDNLRPAGLERTWPNYLNLEGVRGNEQFPSARHNVTLPFTRNVAGPMDYTICYAHARNQTTNAHQMAMSVVYYSPLTSLFWYDEPSKYPAGSHPELTWFDECPTTWEETRALSGSVGEYVVVARRTRNRWFVGAMTNESGRDLDLKLDFLGSGQWNARIFSDGAAAVPVNRTSVEMSERPVRADDRIRLRLAASGGQAIIFSPV